MSYYNSYKKEFGYTRRGKEVILNGVKILQYNQIGKDENIQLTNVYGGLDISNINKFYEIVTSNWKEFLKEGRYRLNINMFKKYNNQHTGFKGCMEICDMYITKEKYEDYISDDLIKYFFYYRTV